MDTFLSQSNYSILYSWFKNQLSNPFEEKKDNWALSLFLNNQHYQASISFYETGVIEEIVKDIQNDNVLYYIHFHFMNLYQGSTMLNEFLTYLNNLKQNEKHIVICCSCGMTSSLFAEEFQKFLVENKVDFCVSASDIHSLEKNAQTYDFILLTPQVNYYKPKLIEKLKAQIISIPTTDYACHNYINILSIVNHHLKKENSL